MAEINADREAHGKTPLDDDGDPPRPTKKKRDNTSKKKLARRKKAGFKTVTKSTTDPDCGMFVKEKHERQFAYEAHTACDKNSYVLETVVTSGNIHDNVAFDDVYDKVTQTFPEIETIVADSAYKTPHICKKVFEDGWVLSTAYKRPMTMKGGHEWWKYVYTWLSGLMKCGYCGYAMTVTNNTKKNTFYLSCGGRKRGICFERKETIQAIELEKIVEIQLFDRMKTILENEKALVPVEDSKKVNDLKIKMVEVQQHIDALTESIANLSVRAIAEVDKATTREVEKKDSLAAELEEALREQRSKNYSQYNIEEYISNWESYDTEEKKRMARIFIDRVIVKDGDIEVVMK